MKIGNLEITVHRHPDPSQPERLSLEANLQRVSTIDAGTVTRDELRELAAYLVGEADKEQT